MLLQQILPQDFEALISPLNLPLGAADRTCHDMEHSGRLFKEDAPSFLLLESDLGQDRHHTPVLVLIFVYLI